MTSFIFEESQLSLNMTIQILFNLRIYFCFDRVLSLIYSFWYRLVVTDFCNNDTFKDDYYT